jgi:hypothetical protein
MKKGRAYEPWGLAPGLKKHLELFPFFQIISSQIFIVNALNIIFYGL